MDIHKPKAAHSWREFLIEIGTIICGILIALGLEQGVEWLHWRHQVEMAEESLTKDVRVNLLGNYVRILVRPCLSARIAELRNRLVEPAGAWKGMPTKVHASASSDTLASLANPESNAGYTIPPVYVAPSYSGGTGAWSAAVANGVASHMPTERASGLGALFREFEFTRDMQGEEQQAVRRLTPLAFDRNLNEPERTQYLGLLGELDQMNAARALFAAQSLMHADALGLRLETSKAQKMTEVLSRYFNASCVDRVKIPLAPG